MAIRSKKRPKASRAKRHVGATFYLQKLRHTVAATQPAYAAKIGSFIAAGGAAEIYAFDPPLTSGEKVAKIFLPDKRPHILTNDFIQRLAFYLSRRDDLARDIPFVPWPDELILALPALSRSNLADNLQGFTMPFVKNTQKLANILGQPALRRAYCGTPDGLNLIITIAHQLNQLHQHDFEFVLGDFSPNNVLVSRNKRDVTFIDPDSFQCRRGTRVLSTLGYTPGYTSPRAILNARRPDDEKEPLQADDDTFILAIYACMLLVDGHPFQTGSSYRYPGGPDRQLEFDDNIRDRRFVFADPTTFGAVGMGPDNYKKLPAELKQTFERAFISDTPPSAENWLSVLTMYRDGTLAKHPSPAAAHLAGKHPKKTPFKGRTHKRSFVPAAKPPTPRAAVRHAPAKVRPFPKRRISSTALSAAAPLSAPITPSAQVNPTSAPTPTPQALPAASSTTSASQNVAPPIPPSTAPPTAASPYPNPASPTPPPKHAAAKPFPQRKAQAPGRSPSSSQTPHQRPKTTLSPVHWPALMLAGFAVLALAWVLRSTTGSHPPTAAPSPPVSAGSAQEIVASLPSTDPTQAKKPETNTNPSASIHTQTKVIAGGRVWTARRANNARHESRSQEHPEQAGSSHGSTVPRKKLRKLPHESPYIRLTSWSVSNRRAANSLLDPFLPPGVHDALSNEDLELIALSIAAVLDDHSLTAKPRVITSSTANGPLKLSVYVQAVGEPCTRYAVDLERGSLHHLTTLTVACEDKGTWRIIGPQPTVGKIY